MEMGLVVVVVVGMVLVVEMVRGLQQVGKTQS
jgi:hypothetical protein